MTSYIHCLELVLTQTLVTVFPTRTNERMVCDTPAGFSGYSLLSQNPRMPATRNALHMLTMVCRLKHDYYHLKKMFKKKIPT
jgi:hypothetical protein